MASSVAQSAETAVATSEATYAIDTKLYHVVFSNRGAVVKSWTLRNVKDSNGKPLELVNPKGGDKFGFPFSYEFRGQKPSVDLNTALWVAHPTRRRNGDRIRLLRRPHGGRKRRWRSSRTATWCSSPTR